MTSDDGIRQLPSILSDNPGADVAVPAADVCLSDLNLNQLVSAIVGKYPDDDLAPLFAAPLRRVSTVQFRQAVLRDLDNPALAGCVSIFGERMRRVRSLLATAAKIPYRHQHQGWVLDAANAYCHAVRDVATGLADADLRSQGLQDIRAYLRAYEAGETFTALTTDARNVQDQLSAVQYALRIKGSRITVCPYEGEDDYSAAVLKTFAKFKQGAAKDYRVRFPPRDVNHVQEQILELVAGLHPETFVALDAFSARHAQFIDPGVAAFGREAKFYLAWLEFIAPLRAAGLPFCTPRIDDRGVRATRAFDVVLASHKVSRGEQVVVNDVLLQGAERILVVTGPNQGGKTTFARTVGQLHYLAGLGLSVPARDATLVLADRIFTHFERRERLENLRGKLEDELVRVRDILHQATERSVVIMNETFSSTALEDARYLGRKILDDLIACGVLGVYVTFVDELASPGEATVSMVASVSEADPAVRTFKVVRRPADGLAYAWAIAAKHGLTYDAIREEMA